MNIMITLTFFLNYFSDNLNKKYMLFTLKVIFPVYLPISRLKVAKFIIKE